MPLGARETKKLEVVEACSGIRSLMTLVTLAVVLAYFTHPKSGGQDGQRGGWLSFWKRYSFWRAVLLVASAIPIAILTNALRVSGTGILAHYYGTQVADGFFHSFSGWVVYVVAFLMLFAVGWLLDRVGKIGKGDNVDGPAEDGAQEMEAETAVAGVGNTTTVNVASVKGAD
jgi:exosortase/archaeosortase family protein